MGFSDVKRRAIALIREGEFEYDPLTLVVPGRNLLADGEIDEARVVALLSRCRGPQYECGRHHQDNSIDVHIFKPMEGPQQWYVKLYFLETDDGGLVMFMSVHKGKKGGAR